MNSFLKIFWEKTTTYFLTAYSFIYLQFRNFFPKFETYKIKEKNFGKVLVFSIENAKYKLVIPKGKKNLPPAKICNEKGDVITRRIKPYMGPNNDFFGSCTTCLNPKLFKCEKIEITNVKGEKKVFVENDALVS